MAKFSDRHFPPFDVQRDPLPPSSKLHISVKELLYSHFKEELLRPKSPLSMLMVNAPGFEHPFPVKLQVVGHTALVARWLEGIDTAALTLLLAGVDNREDDQALEIAFKELCVIKEVEQKVRQLISMIRAQPRPLAATIHFAERTYDDQATRVSVSCLAEAFFDQFGAAEDGE